MNKLIGFLIVFITIVVLGSCTPTKTTTASVSKSETTADRHDSTVQVQTKMLDLLLRRLTETKEEFSEWATERTDYNVVDYDTLGRIVRSATQTTDRQSGRQNDKHTVDNIAASLTLSQVDSLMSLSRERVLSKIEEKNTIVVERSLAWWQKLLMYLGAVAAATVLFFATRRITRLFL